MIGSMPTYVLAKPESGPKCGPNSAPASIRIGWLPGNSLLCNANTIERVPSGGDRTFPATSGPPAYDGNGCDQTPFPLPGLRLAVSVVAPARHAGRHTVPAHPKRP